MLKQRQCFLRQGLLCTLILRRASIRQLEVLGRELCSLLVPLVSPARSDLTRPPDTGQGRSSTQPWFRVGRRLRFHSWAGAPLTHCFCSSAGKPRLPGALDPRTEGLIWPPSWVGLSFSTLGHSPQKGASAWLRPLYLGVPERFSVARQACQAWQVTARWTISTLVWRAFVGFSD